MELKALHLNTEPNQAAREARFRTFLDAHLDQELLRFSTAGSVDDGKSTLIGRLLHDTKSVYEDQLASIRASRVNRSGNAMDLSLLTDGLRAEREQGITIDVAYRYFSTSKRKFIIADTPGHEQYTRNMATGASTADVAVVLIDANAFRKAGSLLPQSRRHTYIASLLRIPHIVAAVNKMDLVGYDQAIFSAIQEQFLALAHKLDLRSVSLIPVSALAGDNVVEASSAMPWYTGPTLLDFLETVPLHQTVQSKAEPLRFPVQLVARPDASFRGFAGRVERGILFRGQTVRALPSGRTARVRSLVTYDGELKQANAPQSVTIELDDEIDLSRGEMLVGEDQRLPTVSTRVRAMAVWMHEQVLTLGSTYLLKHTTRTVRATVRSIGYRVDVNTADRVDAVELGMNDIAELDLETSLPLFFDPYTENRFTGSFILIDPLSNATVGAGMLLSSAEETGEDTPAQIPLFILWEAAKPEELERVRRRLEFQGRRAVLVDDPLIPASALPAVVRALELAEATAVSVSATLPPEVLQSLGSLANGRILHRKDEIEQWLERP